MKVAFYPGCTAQTDQFGYEASVRSVMPCLDVELKEMEGAGCCGYPAYSSVNEAAWYYSSARNMALAEQIGLPMLTLCNGCHLSFTETKHSLGKDLILKGKINEQLAKEGLYYEGDVELIHIFELLHDRIGAEKICAAVIKPLIGFRFGAHPGCHSIRPSKLGRPDEAENPRKLDDLINWLGAEAVEYPGKIDCCGSSLASASGKTVMEIAGDKLKTVKSLGLDGLVTTCPFCFKVYDNKQKAIAVAVGDRTLEVPVFYYTQLLGLAMGQDQEKLGLELNLSPIDSVLARIGGM
ncbi:MAG: CoB--CoM heterodisulfide reductase iron-sulfur subunit B family protein [Candidatus Bathyarchaeota archaeon]|nr:CoB--CoM heterodisulfide reductase iron-sulfur subunit B family protein [Candidatus Bathyarchaeota archaeon]